MADVLTPEQRKKNMQAIRSKNTSIELKIRKYLHSKGFRYKLHTKTLPGTPDIVLPKYKTVIFVHGCFFHGHHNCKDFKIPNTNREKWLKKINTNIENDARFEKEIKELGWKVLIVWGCELKAKKMSETLANLPGKIISNSELY